MSEIKWNVEIDSKLCPYRRQGGHNDNSANAVFYEACAILTKHSSIDLCCHMRCPRR